MRRCRKCDFSTVHSTAMGTEQVVASEAAFHFMYSAMRRGQKDRLAMGIMVSAWK